MTQASLFAADLQQQRPNPCLASETATSLSPMRDKRATRRMARLAAAIDAAEAPLDRVKLAMELRDLAEAFVHSGIRVANDGGATWREIGTELGVPFQTLYRRYGGQA